ncbi:MAG: hypothetical protein ACI9NG_002096 [Hyphomonas sp.]|jgi:hypothetical protein
MLPGNRTEHVKKTLVIAAACVALMSCSDASRDGVTFNCEANEQASPELSRTVGFHFAQGYLFVQNDVGGADNVCAQAGTTACDVKMTDAALTLRQDIAAPYCGWRSSVKSTLDIDRRSGHFLFMQEGCEPGENRVMTGQCTFDSGE